MEKNPQLRVGIIGFGEMGKRHALEYYEATQGRMDFPAVVEPDPKRYKEGCEWFGKSPRRYDNVEAMLENEKLDALIIASPNCFHKENFKACRDSALPLMLEKPLESSFEKICDIVRLHNDYNAPVMVDHVMRYAPIIQKAKSLIENGEIGKVCSFNFVQYHSGGALFTTYRRTIEGGGGQLIEKATHDLDVAFYLCSAAPRKVSAVCRLQKYGGDKPEDLTCSKCDDFECSGRIFKGESAGEVKDINFSHDLCRYAKNVDVSDNETCLIQCTNGVFGVYSHCFFVANHFSRRYEIIGTEGVLYIELSMFEKNKDSDGRIILSRNSLDLASREEFKFRYEGKIHYKGGPYTGRHFYNMIQGKAEPFTTVEDAFAAEMTGIAAMRSSEEDRQIDIEDIVPKDILPSFRKAYL